MSFKNLPNVETQTRSCLQCGQPLRGRSDKKFCDCYCRSAYYYINGESPQIIRCINNILKRNREILKDVLAGGVIVEVEKSVLELMDFNFSYHTHYSMDTYKKPTFFCYEYEYWFKEIRNPCVVICKTKNLPEREVH